MRAIQLKHPGSSGMKLRLIHSFQGAVSVSSDLADISLLFETDGSKIFAHAHDAYEVVKTLMS